MWWQILLKDFELRYNPPTPLTREALARIQADHPGRWVNAELRTILYYYKLGL